MPGGAKKEKVKAKMAECPYVDRSFTPFPAQLNRAITYPCQDGTEYVFCEHDDGFGALSKVQFCQLMGHKRDVFGCLNESEWRLCPYYKHKTAKEKQLDSKH